MISSSAEPAPSRIVKTSPELMYFAIFDLWPKFRAMSDVRGVKIKEVRQAPVNFPSDDGGTWELVPVNEKIKPILVPHSFYNTWKPAADGYFVYHSSTGLNYFLSGSQFETEFAAVYAPPPEEEVRQSRKISELPHSVPAIQLDTRTKLQMALILVESGTPDQRKEAAQFLTQTFANWHCS